MDYTKLVRELRQVEGFFYKTHSAEWDVVKDAADAIESLQARITELEQPAGLIYTCSCVAYQAKIVELESQLVEYKADAERYCFQRDADFRYFPLHCYWEDKTHNTSGKANTYEEAIDAAIAKVKDAPAQPWTQEQIDEWAKNQKPAKQPEQGKDAHGYKAGKSPFKPEHQQEGK